jgi:hypothetical protein
MAPTLAQNVGDLLILDPRLFIWPSNNPATVANFTCSLARDKVIKEFASRQATGGVVYAVGRGCTIGQLTYRGFQALQKILPKCRGMERLRCDPCPLWESGVVTVWRKVPIITATIYIFLT